MASGEQLIAAAEEFDWMSQHFWYCLTDFQLLQTCASWQLCAGGGLNDVVVHQHRTPHKILSRSWMSSHHPSDHVFTSSTLGGEAIDITAKSVFILEFSCLMPLPLAFWKKMSFLLYRNELSYFLLSDFRCPKAHWPNLLLRTSFFAVLRCILSKCLEDSHQSSKLVYMKNELQKHWSSLSAWMRTLYVWGARSKWQYHHYDAITAGEQRP